MVQSVTSLISATTSILTFGIEAMRSRLGQIHCIMEAYLLIFFVLLGEIWLRWQGSFAASGHGQKRPVQVL